MGDCLGKTQKRQNNALQLAANRKKEMIKVIECDICLEPMKTQLSLSCNHSFHQKCLGKHAQTSISRKQTTIFCPSGCNKEISYEQMKKIVSAELFQIHEKNLLELCIQAGDQYLFCPTANCVGIYQIADEDIQYFQCLFCKRQYCLICRKAQHGDADCNFGEEELLSKAAMSKAGMKPCPYCGRMVDKVNGCNAVTCVCGNQFCHDCGGTQCPHGTCIKNKNQSESQSQRG